MCLGVDTDSGVVQLQQCDLIEPGSTVLMAETNYTSDYKQIEVFQLTNIPARLVPFVFEPTLLSQSNTFGCNFWPAHLGAWGSTQMLPIHANWVRPLR